MGTLRKSLDAIIAKEDYDVEVVGKDEYIFETIAGESIDEEISTVDYGLNSNNPDICEAAQLALHSLVYTQALGAKWDVQRTFDLCESPIESVMLGALILVTIKKDYGVSLPRVDWNIPGWKPGGFFPSRHRPVAISIKPQAEIGDYRVDFQLRMDVIKTQYPEESFHEKNPYLIVRPDLANHSRVRKHLIVECDGHDFHEKTKAQAAHDKKRDRALQSLSYKVFRFTGAEIHKDAIACAFEVLDGFKKDTGSETPIEKKSLIFYLFAICRSSAHRLLLATIAARPASGRARVDNPPCIRQRFFPSTQQALQGVLARVNAPHNARTGFALGRAGPGRSGRTDAPGSPDSASAAVSTDSASSQVIAAFVCADRPGPRSICRSPFCVTGGIVAASVVDVIGKLKNACRGVHVRSCCPPRPRSTRFPG